MKFDKFGAFPRTESPSVPNKNVPDISSILKLLPSIFSQKKEQAPQKEENIKSPYTPKNAQAYADYIAKHDEFVRSISDREKQDRS